VMIGHEGDFVGSEGAGFDLRNGAGIGCAPDGDVVDELHRTDGNKPKRLEDRNCWRVRPRLGGFRPAPAADAANSAEMFDFYLAS